jgi:hypothetical protein
MLSLHKVDNNNRYWKKIETFFIYIKRIKLRTSLKKIKGVFVFDIVLWLRFENKN